MGKVIVLKDVVDELKRQNKLIEDQTEKQGKTEEAIEQLSAIVHAYISETRMERIKEKFEDAEGVSKSKSKHMHDPRSFMPSDIIRKDLLSALLGAGSTLALSFAGLVGLFKFASTLSSIIDPREYDKFDKDFRTFIAHVTAFFVGVQGFIKTVEAGLRGLTRLPFIGRGFQMIGNIINNADRYMQSFFRMSPGNIVRMFERLGSFFNFILKIDLLIKGIGSSIKEFQKSGNIKNAIFSGLKTLLAEAINIAMEIIKTMYQSSKFVFGKLFKWTRFNNILEKMNNKIMEDWGINIGQFLVAVDQGFMNHFEDIKQFMMDFSVALLGEIEKLFTMENVKKAFNGFKKLFNTVVDNIKKSIEPIIEFFKNIKRKIEQLGARLAEISDSIKIPDLRFWKKDKDEPEIKKSGNSAMIQNGEIERRQREKKAMETQSNSQTVVVSAPSSSTVTSVRTGDMINMPPMRPDNLFDPAFMPVPSY